MIDGDEPGTVLWVSDTVICRMVEHDSDPRYEIRIAIGGESDRIEIFSHYSDATRYATELLHAHGGD